MKRIGVRELRQNASVWLRRVEGGETFEVVRHGRPVAWLTPVPVEREADPLERLVAEGHAKRGRGDLIALGPPLPPARGAPPLSETLERMREHER